MRAIRSPLLHAIALFLLNIWVACPYLALNYSAHPWGNDYSYIAIARLFREQHWSWNALQYCGAPFRYLYPPLFHIGVALLPMDLGKAFHVFSACAYALTPVALFFLVLRVLQSPAAALFAGFAYSLLPSPIYLLLPAWHTMAAGVNFAPLNLIGLTRFDESPHYLAFALGLLAIAFAWHNSPKLAACLGAAVLLTNVPGAIGFFLLLVALALAKRRIRTAICIGVTAFGLAAFWITPGYGAAVVLTNRVLLSSQTAVPHWSWSAFAILSSTIFVATGVLWKVRDPGVRFACLWVAITGVVVGLSAVSGVSVLPLANRYGLEWNAALVFAVTLLLFSGSARWRRLVSLCVLLTGAWVSRGFLAHPWKWQVERGEPGEMVSFQAAHWLESHAAESGRTFASGDVENGLDAWGAVKQAGGSFTGMSNLLVVAAANRIQGSCQPLPLEKRVAELWLRALNIRSVVVNEPSSAEAYHWMAHPEIFDSFQTVWANGRGDRIVTVPANGSEAVVVDLAALERLPKLTSIADPSFLEAYAGWAHGRRDAGLTWNRNDHATLTTTLAQGEGVLVKTSFDPGWDSSLGKVEADPIGFLLIRPDHQNRSGVLQFEIGWDVWLGIFISIGIAMSLIVGRSSPWVSGFALLLWGTAFLVCEHRNAPDARVAEQEFRTNRLPLINFGGIVDSGSGLAGPRILSIYGTNFGEKEQSVRVLIGERPATVLFRGPNVITARDESSVLGRQSVTVEVNGCRGNTYLTK